MTKILSTTDYEIFKKREGLLKRDGFARLSLWHNAKKFTSDKEVLVSLASTYYENGAYDKAVDCWFEFLTRTDNKDDIEDAYYGLANCFFKKQNDKICTFYLNRIFEQSGPLDASMLEDGIVDLISETDEKDRSAYKIVWPPEKVDYFETLHKARALSLAGENDEAISLASEIPEESEYYSHARIEVAFSEFLKGNEKYAVSVYEEVVEKNPKDITALCHLANAYYYTFEYDKANACLDKAVELGAKDETEETNTFLVACTLIRNDIIIPLAKKALAGKPFSLLHLFAKAIAHYNEGDLISAKEGFYKCLCVSPENIAYLYFKNLVDNDILDGKKGEKHAFSIAEKFPEELTEVYKNTVVELSKINMDRLSSALKSKKNEDALRWAIRYGEPEVNRIAVCIIAGAKNKWCVEEVKRLLLSCEVPDVLKQLVVTALVTSGYSKKLVVTLGNIFFRIKIAGLSDGVSDKTLFAYSGCVNALIAIGESETVKFKKSAERLDLIFGKEVESFSPIELSALIMLYAGHEKLSAPSVVSKVFLMREKRFNDLKSKAEKIIEKRNKGEE